MSLDIGCLTFANAPPPRWRADESGVIPDAPPPEVLVEVRAAGRRAAQLAAAGHELHFATDGISARLRVQVRELATGRVLETIPPSQALDVLSGREL
jgi:hypothetical protein